MSHVLVVGAGAIGGLYASRLQAAGCYVVTLCRSNYDVVSKNGFSVESWCFGTYQYHPSFVTNSVKEAAAKGPFDYILVCLKVLPQLYNTADIIADAVSPRTCIVLIQNGIDIERPIAEKFPSNTIISVVAITGVSQPKMGSIHHITQRSISMGVYRDGDKSKLQHFKDILKLGGIGSTLRDDTQSMRWNKLLWNATFNPISILAGCVDTKVLLSDENIEQLIRSTMDEILQIAQADLGQKEIKYHKGDRTIHEWVTLTKGIPPYKPSMLWDYVHKRPLETEAILGNALSIAKKHGLEAPRLEAIQATLTCLDRTNRSKL